MVAFSIALAWLYGHTEGSLLLTMLMHSAFNQTIGIMSDILQQGEKPFALGASLSFLLTIVWMWVAAACFGPNATFAVTALHQLWLGGQ